MSFFRKTLKERGVVAAGDIGQVPDKRRVHVAGVVLVRQRPGSAKGVVFITLEDETGIVNCVVWPKTLEQYRRVMMSGRLLLVRGRIQKHKDKYQDIIHVMAEHLEDWSLKLEGLTESSTDTRDGNEAPPALAHPVPHHHPRNVRVIPKSRDFH